MSGARSHVKLSIGRGMFTLVDACDLPKLAPYRWEPKRRHIGRKYYVGTRTTPNHRFMLMHRFIMGVHHLDPRTVEIDHKNRDGLDNRRRNLRRCSHKQNCLNQGIRSKNSSGYPGVTFHKKTGQWTSKYRGKFVGNFLTAEDAYLARDRFIRRSKANPRRK